MIRSSDNARVVAARKLHQRKERVAAGAFLVEGPHAAGAAIASRRHRVRELFVATDAADREVELLRSAARADVAVTVVADRVAESLAETQHPQGVVAVVELPHTSLDDIVDGRPRLLAVLDRAGDPGNVGTVVRTADAAGADAVLLTRGCADPYGGKAVRASAGSVLHLPIVTDLSLPDVVGRLRAAGLTVLATTTTGDDLDGLDAVLGAPTAWLFGNEAHGLDEGDLDRADRRVRVPIHGRAESLNLAAAAAVCLYASARAQRR